MHCLMSEHECHISIVVHTHKGVAGQNTQAETPLLARTHTHCVGDKGTCSH